MASVLLNETVPQSVGNVSAGSTDAAAFSLFTSDVSTDTVTSSFNTTLFTSDVSTVTVTSSFNTTVFSNESDLLWFGNFSNETYNGTEQVGPFVPPPPNLLGFNRERYLTVIGYGILFLIGAVGNITVLVTLLRNRRRSRIVSRVNFLIMHLAIADLIVTFVMIPLEVGWAITIAFKAGDVMCRIMAFWRNFGLYLSSWVLVAISLDRYFAIVHPLSVRNAGFRARIMLGCAWGVSTVCSLPQSIIFHIESHPLYDWFQQCVVYNFFKSPAHQMAYLMFTFFAMYLLPLIVITVSYTIILYVVIKKTRETKANQHATNGGLRRSGTGNIGRAKVKTLKMTLIIVIAFILCWTPYYVMCLWYWFDRETARKVDPIIQRGLFLFAVSNSCMDPIVYGFFTMNLKREIRRCCPCLNKGQKRDTLFNSFYSGGHQPVARYDSDEGRTPLRQMSMYEGRNRAIKKPRSNPNDRKSEHFIKNTDSCDNKAASHGSPVSTEASCV